MNSEQAGDIPETPVIPEDSKEIGAAIVTANEIDKQAGLLADGMYTSFIRSAGRSRVRRAYGSRPHFVAAYVAGYASAVRVIEQADAR